MFGYTDEDMVTGWQPEPTEFWSPALWRKKWRDVFNNFTVIEGITKRNEVVQELRDGGKIFAYHVSNNLPLDQFPTELDESQISGATEYLATQWTKPFTDPVGGPGGFDAIMVDEFHSCPDNSICSRIAAGALKKTRERFPNKLIFASGVWRLADGGEHSRFGRKDITYDQTLNAIKNYADIFVLENYQNSSNQQLELFDIFPKNLEERSPGLTAKTIQALGIAQTQALGNDTNPSVNFRNFLRAQIPHVLRANTLRGTRKGLGYWVFYRTKNKTVDGINEDVILYKDLVNNTTEYEIEGNFTVVKYLHRNNGERIEQGRQTFSYPVTAVSFNQRYVFVGLRINNSSGRLVRYESPSNGVGMFGVTGDGISSMGLGRVAYQDFSAVISSLYVDSGNLEVSVALMKPSGSLLIRYKGIGGTGPYMFRANQTGISPYPGYDAGFAATYLGSQAFNSPVLTMTGSGNDILLGLSNNNLIRYDRSNAIPGENMFCSKPSGVEPLPSSNACFQRVWGGVQPFNRPIVEVRIPNKGTMEIVLALPEHHFRKINYSISRRTAGWYMLYADLTGIHPYAAKYQESFNAFFLGYTDY